MGKQPQKLREALSNKACLSQVPAQELKKAPRTSICPTCNPWFQWHFSHLQPVRWIHFKLHSAAFTEVFLSFSARREEKSTLTSVLCAVWFHFFFYFLPSMWVFSPFKPSHHQLTMIPMERDSFSITISPNEEWF